MVRSACCTTRSGTSACQQPFASVRFGESLARPLTRSASSFIQDKGTTAHLQVRFETHSGLPIYRPHPLRLTCLKASYMTAAIAGAPTDCYSHAHCSVQSFAWPRSQRWNSSIILFGATMTAILPPAMAVPLIVTAGFAHFRLGCRSCLPRSIDGLLHHASSLTFTGSDLFNITLPPFNCRSRLRIGSTHTHARSVPFCPPHRTGFTARTRTTDVSSAPRPPSLPWIALST